MLVFILLGNYITTVGGFDMFVLLGNYITIMCGFGK